MQEFPAVVGHSDCEELEEGAGCAPMTNLKVEHGFIDAVEAMVVGV